MAQMRCKRWAYRLSNKPEYDIMAIWYLAQQNTFLLRCSENRNVCPSMRM